MRQAAFSFLFALLALTTHAQHHPQQVDSAKNKVSCVFDIFSQGHTEGNIRVYHMNTYHPIANDFYYATAFGGRINYHSASFHGFSLGIGGVFIFGMGEYRF